MRLPFLSKNRIANLEIKDDVIRYVEIKNKHPLVISRFGERYLPKGTIEQGRIVDIESFQQILRDCIQKWKLKGKSIQFLIPDSAVVIRKVDVPVDVPNEEIKGHLYFELDHSIHLPFDEPVLDAVVLKETEQKKEVLLVAAPESIVHALSDQLKDFRTNPIVADISPLSQYRLFHHFHLTNDGEHYLLLQLNMNSVTVSIFDENRPTFMQLFHIPYMKEAWDPEISEDGSSLHFRHCDQDMILTAFQDIYIEIDRILRFYQYSLHNGTREITKILLTGDHPFFTLIMQTMKQRYNIPVLTISSELAQTVQNETLDQRWYSALGLAIREGT